MRYALIVLFFCSFSHAAIAFRCSQAGPNPNGGNVAQNVCAATANGDYMVVGVVAATPPTSNAIGYATPSGWTMLCWGGGHAVFGKFWSTGDPTSVTLVPQNGTGGFETSGQISYSGVNATTPVDRSACYWADGSSGGQTLLNTFTRAPGLSPQWTTDQDVRFYFNSNSGGITITLNAALTSRLANNPGPTVLIGDKALSTAANTGNLDSTCTCSAKQGGASVLLMPAAGGVSASTPDVPAIAALSGSASNALVNFAVSGASGLYPQNGDFICDVNVGSSSGVTASGWSQILTITNATVLCKTWHTGDATSLTLSGSAASPWNFLIALRNPNFGVKPNSPGVDTSGSASHIASGTSISAPTLTLASTSEIVLGFFFANTVVTWTLPASLATDAGSSGTFSTIEGSQMNPSSPTGTYTATTSGASALDAVDVAFKLVTGAAFQSRHNPGVF